ncbi:Phosphate-import ATP-binding protein PhnC [Polaromonas vacuolata]|uniref:Phosphate-import ATP-binding protein PhnC n=1 Tax=Polaromonas vacuolata TaxID=37448 RepID=A0A6H2H746_9BURK|nr:ATP-binding cassette domain-containing protein [Polaromonas vacuolata]QJC55587.1 Phosphate-import ATP-binding protein PhnC [Polaromonas vacuolata]
MSASAVVFLDSVKCKSGADFELSIDSLTIEAGERVAIVGHNGAGKSTLFRLLSGFIAPDQGSVQILQRALHTPLNAKQMRGLRSEVGQVMQGLHLVQRLSVIENVLIGCLGRFHGWRSWARIYPESEVTAACDALNSVGLLAYRDMRTDSLSGGERQKVAIARLLLQRPRLILADEPTAALDPTAAREVCQLMTKAAAQSTLVCIIHNPALLPLLADRVIGLKNGFVAFDLPVSAVDTACLEALYSSDNTLTSTLLAAEHNIENSKITTRVAV